MLKNSRSPCCQQVRSRKDLLSHGTGRTPGLDARQGEVGDGLMAETFGSASKRWPEVGLLTKRTHRGAWRFRGFHEWSSNRQVALLRSQPSLAHRRRTRRSPFFVLLSGEEPTFLANSGA